LAKSLPALCTPNGDKSMSTNLGILLFVSVLLQTTSALAVDSSASPTSSNPWEVDLMLRSQIYLPTPRPVQDVYFVLNDTTPNLVYRIGLDQAKDPANLAKMAYATTNATPHDVYELAPNSRGPFPKGEALGFTLGQWIAAIGTGTYIEENDDATMNLTFHNLMPNGTYTVWISRITMPPDYKYAFMPVGTSDGSQNEFKADSTGNGRFNLRLKALPPSTNVTYADYVAMYVTKKAPISTNITWTLIAVAYHSDSKTHGATPGELGKTTHVQLVHLMYPKPARTYEDWRNISTGAAAVPNATAQQKQPGFEGILSLIGLFALAYIMIGRRW
jgi:hypothetical protein